MAMTVTDALPLTKEDLDTQTMIRCPGAWDVVSHSVRAANAYDFNHSAADVEHLRAALRHWIEPHIVGERLCGWIGVDQCGHREDWALIKISPECTVVSTFTTPHWDGKKILAQVQKWGIAVFSLKVMGYREPQAGEVVFSDGARSRFTYGVVGTEKTVTYEWPRNASEQADRSKYFTIWAHGIEPIGAYSGDCGSAVFGKAAGGDGIEVVGLLVSVVGKGLVGWRQWV
jgi:hypothetical protein